MENESIADKIVRFIMNFFRFYIIGMLLLMLLDFLNLL